MTSVALKSGATSPPRRVVAGVAIAGAFAVAAVFLTEPAAAGDGAPRAAETETALRDAAEGLWREDAERRAVANEQAAAFGALGAISATLFAITSRPTTRPRRRPPTLHRFRLWSRRAARIAGLGRPVDAAFDGHDDGQGVFGRRTKTAARRNGVAREMSVLRDRLDSIRRLFDARPQLTLFDTLSAAGRAARPAVGARAAAVPLSLYLRELDRARARRAPVGADVDEEVSIGADPERENREYFETVMLDRLRAIGAFHREARIRRAIKQAGDA